MKTKQGDNLMNNGSGPILFYCLHSLFELPIIIKFKPHFSTRMKGSLEEKLVKLFSGHFVIETRVAVVI